MILNCLLVELTHSIAERLKKLCRSSKLLRKEEGNYFFCVDVEDCVGEIFVVYHV